MNCDLTEAIRAAALEYLKKLLINRILRFLGRRAAAALAAVVIGAVADGPLPIGDIIGLIIGVGIALWSAYDLIQLIRQIVDAWRDHFWDGLLRSIPRRLTRLMGADILDCINTRPQCCAILVQSLSASLLEWVRGLRPQWHGGSGWSRSLRFRHAIDTAIERIRQDLRECCS